MVVDWPVPANETFTDGTWRIGHDIQPGLYRVVPNDFCYWERLSGLSGGFDDIIANDNTSSPSYVEVKATDVAFKSQNCGTWLKVEE